MIEAGTTVHGDIHGVDTVEIRGTLEGDVRTTSHCVLHEGAHVRGNVEAAGIVVAGDVEAETLVADKVEIRSTARVRAAVTARVIVIADGALYEGHVEMQSPDAPIGPVVLKERRKDETGRSRA